MIKVKRLLMENPYLKELEYPLAKKEEMTYPAKINLKKGRIVWMPPEKFLKLAYTIPSGEEHSSYTDLESRMKNGLSLDSLELWIDFDIKKVTGHEGRHRAIIAKKLNIKEVPVLIIYDNLKFSDWASSHHIATDNGEFTPQGT